MACFHVIRRFLLVSLLLGAGVQTTAQSVETWQQQLQSGNLKSSDSLFVLNLLSRNLTYIHTDRALQYALLAMELAGKLNDSLQLADAYRNLSNVYSYRQDFAHSMEYLQRAVDIFTRKGDSVGLGNCYISLGHTYRRLKQRQLELNYHKKAYHIFRKLNIKERIGVTAHNLGESYLNAGYPDSARQLTRLAIQINRDIENNPVLSSCYKVMGLSYLPDHQYDSAENYLQQVLALTLQLKEYAQKEAAATAMIRLAEIYRLKHLVHQEKQMLQEALAFCQKNKLYDYLQEVYYQLSGVAWRENQIQQAYIFIK